MAYVPVPKDLNAVKTKVLLNLTKRQLICFGAGAALGVPLFFLLKAHTGVSTAAICMILLMLPFFLWPCMRRTDSPLKRSSATSCRSASCALSSALTQPIISTPFWNGRTI